MKNLFLMLGLALCTSVVVAQTNTLELEAKFKGNQEQPKVLYIVPWRKIEGPAPAYRPLQSLVEQNYALIDRDEFRRGLRYRDAQDAQIAEQAGEGRSEAAVPPP